MKTGRIVKELRLSKKLKSKEVYRDVLTRPASLRFERGESDTTTEKLFVILQRMNISLDEFYFLYYSDQEQINFQIIEELTQTYNLANGESLLALEKKFFGQYEETTHPSYLHYACIARFLATNFLDLPFPQKQVELITNYLFQIQSWNYYELVLFTNSLDMLSHDMVDTVYESVRSKMQSMKEIRRYKNEVFSLISNILVARIQKKEIRSSQFYWNELKQNISIDNTRMYEKTMLLFFQEVISLLENRKSTSPVANQIVEILGFLGMEQKKKQCMKLLQQIEREYYGSE